MKFRRAYYLWLAAIVVFGLVSGSVLTTSLAAPGNTVASVGPITGPTGTLTGCLGSTTSNASVSLGGRVVTPSTILRISPGGLCGSGENNLNVFSYASTVLVSAGANAAANGANLASTLSAVAALVPASNKVYLLKLEPGVYDLGSTPLQLVPYIQVEGSGEGATRIIGTGQAINPSGVVLASAHTELRDLSVESQAGNNYSTGIYASSTITTDFSISHVTVLVSGGSGTGMGIYNDGGSPMIENATIVVSNTTNNGFSYGIFNSGSVAQIKNSSILVQSTSTGQVAGISNFSGSAPLIKDVMINVSTSGVPVPANNLNPDATGISNNFSSPLIQNTNITANTTGGGGSVGMALNNSNTITAITTVEDSDITATSSGSSFTQGILNNTGGGNPAALVVRRSTISVTATNKAGCQALGINSFGGPTNLYNTSISTTVGAGCASALGLALQGGPNDLTFLNGDIKSTQIAIFNSNGTAKVKVGASQLNAPTTVSGSAVCISSFKSDYTATTTTL